MILNHYKQNNKRNIIKWYVKLKIMLTQKIKRLKKDLPLAPVHKVME